MNIFDFSVHEVLPYFVQTLVPFLVKEVLKIKVLFKYIIPKYIKHFFLRLEKEPKSCSYGFS